MPTTTTYEVMKRPADRDKFELHYITDAPLDTFNGPAEFNDLDEAYACAEKLEPEFDTAIRVVETTTHTYYL